MVVDAERLAGSHTWTLGGTGNATDAHGQIFNSFEYYAPGSAPTNTPSPGTERAMWFDATGADDGDYLPVACKNPVNNVAGDESFKFQTVVFYPPSDSTNQVLVPTTTATKLGRSTTKFTMCRICGRERSP